ncbi:flagellar hook protein FlgE [Sporomusa sphaeroides]|uniref:Flagellar hook protein FlgE n=1 Tax=Sporomusa sphaeroides DSM 2875 TaxID=1337886 RepID=A0ABP2C5I7_9FIRM|nr:flagellar hook-basal body complex protein [Sporomusa sphaeroides]OLS58163.1 flagellar hook protein FlgE [Sporomusa sphaeroides DSM 2875]CVK17650.1 Flagellar hook protein FlgE [Sporomusa sphaeroides DSM 2875]
MMRSLFAGVSGLRNHQTRMDVIGNNIANVNTVGFKGSRVNFQDILSQTLQGASSPQGNRGGTNPKQVGLGMAVASIDTIFTDGSYQPTGKQTDLAITGQGFFILADGNQKYYTRAGNFDFDVQGNYVVPGTGLKVAGWMADSVTGNIDSTGDITTIKIPVGEMMKAQQTNKITFGKNLSASAIKTGTAAERAAADIALTTAKSDKDAADLALKNANTALAAANTALSTAQTDEVKAKASQNALVAAQTAMAAAHAAAVALQNGTPAPVPTAADVALLANTAAALAATAADSATSATQTAANDLKNAATNLKTEADKLAATPPTSTIGAVVGLAATAEGFANTAVTAANGAFTTAEAARQAAEADQQLKKTAQTAASQTALDAATAVTNASEAVKAAYNETSKVPMQVTIYDSQGNPYTINASIIKTGDNTWEFTPSGTAVNKDGVTVGTITGNPSTIAFDRFGVYDALNTMVNSLTIDPAGGPYAGAGAFTVDLDFSAISQYASESTAKATEQNGWADGTLDGVTIDATGTIVGNFTNGMSKNLARVAMAVFNNPGGLNKAGDNLYTETNNSGIADIGTSGTGGRGEFAGGTLEMSNVDLAQQFSDMIITQRGFQANSKIITTTDEMLELLANLKR